MKHDFEESLSALVDGELDNSQRHKIADELLTNANARETWHRYHLLRDALKKNLPEELAPNLVDRVCNAIANEPTHKLTSESTFESDKKSSWGFGFKPAYGFVAVAALVVAVVTVSQIENVATDLPELAKTDSNNVNVGQSGSDSVAGGISVVDNSQLSAYLVNHSTRSQRPLQNRLIPYVTSVEYSYKR